MMMQTFKFQGDWQPNIPFAAFKDFQYRQNGNAPIVTLVIQEPSDSDCTDPLPEQLAAIDYLLAHQDDLAQTIIRHIQGNCKIAPEYYGVDDSIAASEYENEAELKQLLGFNQIIIRLEHKAGLSYIGLEGNCAWDPEHGLGCSLHQLQIVEFGDYASAYMHQPDCDNPEVYLNPIPKFPNPIFRHPHPKYGRLKPSQMMENNAYALQLIDTGQGVAFIESIESCEKYGFYASAYQQGLFVNAALKFYNPLILNYLADKNEAVMSWIINSATQQGHVEFLEQRGVDVTSLDTLGWSLLERMLGKSLSALPRYAQEDVSSVYWANQNNALFVEYQDFVFYLLRRGAKGVRHILGICWEWEKNPKLRPIREALIAKAKWVAVEGGMTWVDL